MTKTLHIPLVLLGLFLLQPVNAQSPPPVAEQPRPAEDPIGRSVPRGTVEGLVTAGERGNLDRAAEYLESTLTPAERRELARKLWLVLDRKLRGSVGSVSSMPDGDQGDGLTDRDRVGLVESPSGNVEIFLDRVRPGPDNPIWLFSSSSLQQIPRLYDEIQPPWFEQYVPEPLRTTRWLSLPLYRWIGVFLAVPLIFVIAGLSTRLLTVALVPVFRRFSRHHDVQTLPSAGPLRMLVFAGSFYGMSLLGLTLTMRNFSHRVAETVGVIALCWLALRMIDAAAGLSLKRLDRIHRSGDTALVRLIVRLMKASTVIVTGLLLLYLADVDLTAALTGLGVGGLAIGFGAQKTIENLFGGIMVISDKPVNVGDVCKMGEVVGTIEDIGIRSTRIRTLDRTVVAVPNGQLASMVLENFAMRDRLKFQHTVGLDWQTTASQMRSVLEQIRRLLDAHPRVESTSARTRLIRFSNVSLDVEIFAYVLEREQAPFLAIQEELLLGIMDILDHTGAVIAAPWPAMPLAKGRSINR